ncbi:hypothetical protein CRG98_004077 [Punica granatum]|uniref:Uncharacterized protein n=1 Tax=Punica granatum TaxID=22663 RepID=A0A2I0L4A7_PUNGR|nr:hypothetical protein CRG98_004077 [Punica granatum]
MDPLTNGVKTSRRNEMSKNRKSMIKIRDFPSQGTIDARKKDAAEAITSRDAEIGENLRDETTASHDFLKPAAEGLNHDLVERQSTLLKKDDQEIPCPPERQEDAGKEVYDDRAKFVSEQTHAKEETKEDSEEGKSPTDLSDVTLEVDRATLEAPKVSTDSDSPNRQEKQHESSTESDISINFKFYNNFEDNFAASDQVPDQIDLLSR